MSTDGEQRCWAGLVNVEVWVAGDVHAADSVYVALALFLDAWSSSGLRFGSH